MRPIREALLQPCAEPVPLRNPSAAGVEQWAIQNGKLYRSCATGKQALIEAVRRRQRLAPLD